MDATVTAATVVIVETAATKAKRAPSPRRRTRPKRLKKAEKEEEGVGQAAATGSAFCGLVTRMTSSIVVSPAMTFASAASWR